MSGSQQAIAGAVRSKVSFTPVQSGVLQRKCACGQHTGGGECEECKKKKGMLQRYSYGSAGPATAPPIVREVLRSSGKSLDPETRAFMEPRFGHDFSGVRVHTDERAAESARAVNALAYTVGNGIVFAHGRYAPQTPTGRHLLAHELAHTVQQREGSTLQRASSEEATGEGGQREAEAEAVAAKVSTGKSEGSGPAAKAKGETVADGKPAEPMAPKPKSPACTRTILAEGSCADLVNGSKYRCCDPENGLSNPDRDTDIEGNKCPSHKFTPQFTCEKHCKDALAKGCDDNDNWMAVPPSQFSYKSCGDIYTICTAGKQTEGYVRDKSVTHKSFEVSPGILKKLGVPAGSSFKGAVYRPGADQKVIDKDSCCKA